MPASCFSSNCASADIREFLNGNNLIFNILRVHGKITQSSARLHCHLRRLAALCSRSRLNGNTQISLGRKYD